MNHFSTLKESFYSSPQTHFGSGYKTSDELAAARLAAGIKEQ